MALRAGDLVAVRSASEVLSTLDSTGACEGMPFMPEMVRFLGRRFAVSKVAQKVCDTVRFTGSRRLGGTVMLEDLRCDGCAHDGCQAGCRLYWKEAWLRRTRPGEPAEAPPGTGEQLRALEDVLASHVRRPDAGGTPTPLYRCQATDLFSCTTRWRIWQPTQYLRELTTGNVAPRRFVRVMARAVVCEARRKLGRLPAVHLAGTRREPAPDESVGLLPGEWVEVKSRDELRPVLTPQGRNRGLSFEWEMERYCGGRYRVQSRVTRFIDDRSGRMVELKTNAVILEGVTCTGDYCPRRWFCPRNVYPFWRESWLKRAGGPGATGGTG
jgi:hypothetical protein